MYRLQPIYNIRTRRLHAYELLFDGEGGPASVINWDQLDLFMFQHYLPEIKINSDETIRINVNLTSSSILLIPDEHIERVSKLFKLVIEWNEKSFDNISNPEVAFQLRIWREKYSIEIALDDVCTDQCFLSKVALIKPDIIKLDGSIFRKSLIDPQYRVVAKVAKFACEMIETPFLVEWVEANDELDYAVNILNAQYGQGYLMDKWVDEFRAKIILPNFSKDDFNQRTGLDYSKLFMESING